MLLRWLRVPKSAGPSAHHFASLPVLFTACASAHQFVQMPPRKKQRGAAAAALSPKDAYFERLDAAITAHNCKGSLIVQGIPRAGDDDEEEEEEEEEEKEDTRVRAAPLAPPSRFRAYGHASSVRAPGGHRVCDAAAT